MTKSTLLAVVFCLAFALPHASAQLHPIRDYFRDYVNQVPRHFSPDDPWIMGSVLRTQVGFGGLFFNCDGEESKRHSPYINWNCQNTSCRSRHVVQDRLHQQLEEIKQRIRWGSCNECESCLDCGRPVGNCSCEFGYAVLDATKEITPGPGTSFSDTANDWSEYAAQSNKHSDRENQTQATVAQHRIQNAPQRSREFIAGLLNNARGKKMDTNVVASSNRGSRPSPSILPYVQQNQPIMDPNRNLARIRVESNRKSADDNVLLFGTNHPSGVAQKPGESNLHFADQLWAAQPVVAAASTVGQHPVHTTISDARYTKNHLRGAERQSLRSPEQRQADASNDANLSTSATDADRNFRMIRR